MEQLQMIVPVATADDKEIQALSALAWIFENRVPHGSENRTLLWRSLKEPARLVPS